MTEQALHRTGQRELQPINSESNNMSKPTISANTQKFCRIETTKAGSQVLLLIESDETGVPNFMGMATFMIDNGEMKAPLIFKGPLGDMPSEQMDHLLSDKMTAEEVSEMTETAYEELHAMVLEMVNDGLTFATPEHVHNEHCGHAHSHEAEASELAPGELSLMEAVDQGILGMPTAGTGEDKHQEGCGNNCASCHCK